MDERFWFSLILLLLSNNVSYSIYFYFFSLEHQYQCGSDFICDGINKYIYIYTYVSVYLGVEKRTNDDFVFMNRTRKKNGQGIASYSHRLLVRYASSVLHMRCNLQRRTQIFVLISIRYQLSIFFLMQFDQKTSFPSNVYFFATPAVDDDDDDECQKDIEQLLSLTLVC